MHFATHCVNMPPVDFVVQTLTAWSHPSLPRGGAPYRVVLLAALVLGGECGAAVFAPRVLLRLLQRMRTAQLVDQLHALLLPLEHLQTKSVNIHLKVAQNSVKVSSQKYN